MKFIYKHIRTGNMYEHLHAAFCVKTKVNLIIYRSLETNKVFARESGEFSKKFKFQDAGVS